MDGYLIAVQRLAHFIVKVDAFNIFSMEDRRSLIGNNCHLAINIKSARLLNPCNSPQRQLQVVDDNIQSQKTAVATAMGAKLEYDQIFNSPWCCDATEEVQYKNMMDSLIGLNMDDGECTLFMLAAMFDAAGMLKFWRFLKIWLFQKIMVIFQSLSIFDILAVFESLTSLAIFENLSILKV